ncbi:MAG: RNA polymerase sigma factor [Lysobacterales bacterium]
MSAPELPDQFFRHEYARLVALLTGRFGLPDLASVEDAVQNALAKALERWPSEGQPDNPSGWLYRVALNEVLGEKRQAANHQRLQQQIHETHVARDSSDASTEDADENLLRMLFVCCDAAVPLQSQLVFALKTLCGFDIREIALRLFISEAAAHKRLQRARKGLAHLSQELPSPSPDQYRKRLSAVHEVLYLLFTEGHQSHHEGAAIRRELCDEAIRLSNLLVSHPAGNHPNTHALLALMSLHAARMSARQDAHGGLVLLEDQDRSRWDMPLIMSGMSWLEQSARGDTFSRYHAEAAIAAEHCMASSFDSTRWDRIVSCYDLLDQTGGSSIHQLNRAVAMAHWKGPAKALKELMDSRPSSGLEGSYLWAAVLADLHRQCGNLEKAAHLTSQALELAPTEAIQMSLEHRLRS